MMGYAPADSRCQSNQILQFRSFRVALEAFRHHRRNARVSQEMRQHGEARVHSLRVRSRKVCLTIFLFFGHTLQVSTRLAQSESMTLLNQGVARHRRIIVLQAEIIVGVRGFLHFHPKDETKLVRGRREREVCKEQCRRGKLPESRGI